jgi:hypothetical protein
MSRQSLLLIAAAVISSPVLISSNAFARSAAAHGAISTPHVSTLGAAGRVYVPPSRYGTAGPDPRSDKNPSAKSRGTTGPDPREDHYPGASIPAVSKKPWTWPARLKLPPVTD